MARSTKWTMTEAHKAHAAINPPSPGYSCGAHAPCGCDDETESALNRVVGFLSRLSDEGGGEYSAAAADDLSLVLERTTALHSAIVYEKETLFSELYSIRAERDALKQAGIRNEAHCDTLRAEVARLREALSVLLVAEANEEDDPSARPSLMLARSKARAALSGGGK